MERRSLHFLLKFRLTGRESPWIYGFIPAAREVWSFFEAKYQKSAKLGGFWQKFFYLAGFFLLLGWQMPFYDEKDPFALKTAKKRLFLGNHPVFWGSLLSHGEKSRGTVLNSCILRYFAEKSQKMLENCQKSLKNSQKRLKNCTFINNCLQNVNYS